MKENLLIIISTDNIQSIKQFPLLYSSVALEREYFKSLHVMFWGPSIIVVRDNTEIQKMVMDISKTGVTFSSCVVCSDEYNATQKLESLNITCNHTGELMTKALKDDSYSVITI